MNDFCLRAEKSKAGSGVRPALKARLRGSARIKLLLNARFAASQHRFDRAEHSRAVGVAALVVAQRLEILALQRGQQGDHLLGGEVVVVLDR